MSQPIRVLAVVYKLMPAGLENRLMDIIRNIDRDRIQIDVFTYQLDKGVYDDEVESLGGIVYYNPPLNVKNMFWYVQYFKDFLLKHPEYKIVHAHQDAWCSVFCKGAYLANVPVRIAHSRTAISSTSPAYIAKNIIKLPTRKYANYLFAVSEKAGRWLYGNKLFESGKVQIWPNAIDAKKFYFNAEIRKQVRVENKWDDNFIIMHVGNFTPPKNHPFILDVFYCVYKQRKDARLILVGDGDRKNINSFIEAHHLENIIQLLGSRTDVNKLLQAADFFLFPSIFEGLPGALVEAQAAGLPCLISDTIAEEVYILPDMKILSLSDSCDIWADELLHFEKRNREDACTYIEKKGFDINSLTEKLCLFYEETYKKENQSESL